VPGLSRCSPYSASLLCPGLAAIRRSTATSALRAGDATMLETGDFVRIRFQDERATRSRSASTGCRQGQLRHSALRRAPRSGPIDCLRIGGDWGCAADLRLGCSSIRLETGWFRRRDNNGERARLVVEAHLAKTDAALLAAIIAGQGALGLVYAANRAGRASRRGCVRFLPAQAAAILLKGPRVRCWRC